MNEQPKDQEYSFEQKASELQIPPDIYLRILGKAVTQTKQDIQDMEQALTAANTDVIQSISHRWKGDYDNLRLSELAAAARELNNAAKAGQNTDGLRPLYQNFKNRFETLRSASEKTTG